MKLLAKDIGFKALTDGFCEIYGEKHRAFFEKNGSELIEVGYEAGKHWVDSLIVKKDRLSSIFEMIEKGIMEKEKGEAILVGLRAIFSEEDVQKYIASSENIQDNYQYFMSGSEKYIPTFTEVILESEVKMITTKHFDYFKQFQLSTRYKTVNLFSEGGLGLDEYNKKAQEYMKFENELFYAIEGIPRKYHYFGQLLYKEDALVNWIKFISDNLTNETNYWIAGFFRDIICVLSRDVHTEEIIKSIQVTNKIDIDKSGFISHKQVSAKLSKIAKNR
jgi:hypothetical protein